MKHSDWRPVFSLDLKIEMIIESMIDLSRWFFLPLVANETFHSWAEALVRTSKNLKKPQKWIRIKIGFQSLMFVWNKSHWVLLYIFSIYELHICLNAIRRIQLIIDRALTVHGQFCTTLCGNHQAYCADNHLPELSVLTSTWQCHHL